MKPLLNARQARRVLVQKKTGRFLAVTVEDVFRATFDLLIAELHKKIDGAGICLRRDFAFRDPVEDHPVEVHLVRIGGMRPVPEHPHLLAKKIEGDVGENVVVVVGGELVIRQP